MTDALLPLESLVKYGGGPKWTVAMVGLTGGERYYWLTRNGNETAMVPAFVLADEAAKLIKRRERKEKQA